MKVNGHHYRSIFPNEALTELNVIDQRLLPFKFELIKVKTADEMIFAIKDMALRGAPLIGAAGAFGVMLAIQDFMQSSEYHTNLTDYYHYANNQFLKDVVEINSTVLNFGKSFYLKADEIKHARPTAVNLKWAVDNQLFAINDVFYWEDKLKVLKENALKIWNEDVEQNRKIGEYGLEIIKDIAKKKKNDVVNILTHCNAGWLATVDYGTALSPIFLAHEAGIKVHVWVDETRPRNQGAKLTAWELMNENIPHHLISDNTGGHLMQNGMVDMVIVGTDRTTLKGDVTNKIGTYLKALAAKDNNIPFYVAAPSGSIDFTFDEDYRKIEIEERSADEVLFMDGIEEGEYKQIRITHENTPARNWAFDVTPAQLVTGLITERGICNADKKSILNLFPEKA